MSFICKGEGGTMKNKFYFVLMIAALVFNSSVFAQGQPNAESSSPPMQSAISKPNPQNKISLDIKGMDIIDVLKMLAQRSGMNIVVGKNVTGRVTLFLKDVDLWDAFEIILAANDLAYDKKGDIVNVMTQRDYELLYGGRYQDKKIAKVMRLKYAKAQDLSRALTQIKSNLGKVVVDEGSNTLALIDSVDRIQEMEDFIKKTDLPLETRVFSLNYAQADKLSPKIQEAVTKNVGSMRLDERTNKIVVTDYPANLDNIAKVISAFDEKTPQVLIDAQIVEINPNKDEFSMGVDWDYWIKKNFHLISSLAAPGLTDAAIIPTKLAFGVASGDQTATVGQPGQYKSILGALRIIGETKIISSPRIMVLNNQEAKILVGTKDAYITSTTTLGASGTSVTSQSVNFVDVGIKLYVTPTISRDGFVTMKVRPEVSSSTRTNITSDGKITQIPIVTTSETETSILVKDGTTIIIAGLKKNQRQKEERKFPILGDIPILKTFFKSVSDEKTKTELVIFITPYIVTGEEPLEYTSLVKDKDIADFQSLAKARYLEKKGMGSSGIEGYKKAVFEKIKSVLPSSSGNESVLGRVDISFTLSSDGQLKGRPRVISSSNQDLDSRAMEYIEKISPFPPFPQELKKQEESFNITLEYK